MATHLLSESNAPVAPSQPPRLLDQLFSALRAANYGPKNAERHVEWCRQFILFHGKRHPRDLDATDVQRFLDHLAVEQKLAVAWQREAAGALAFLYRQVLGMERGLPEVGRVRDGPPNGRGGEQTVAVGVRGQRTEDRTGVLSHDHATRAI